MTTPVIYDLHTDYARFGLDQTEANRVIGYRFEHRQGAGITGTPTFIVLHIQAGSTKSSLDYWANAHPASSTVMAQHDGSILKVIPENHGPWTNGITRSPTAQGKRLDDLPGNSNLWTVSVEAEGMTGDDITAVQLDAIEWQCRDWMTRYHIPVENVIRHADVDSVQKPNCPGAYYARIMARLRADPPVPVHPPVAPIWWKPGDVGPQTRPEDGAVALAFLGQVKAKKGGVLYASVGGAKVGNFAQGDLFTAVGSYVAGNKVKWIMVTKDGVYPRVRFSSFTPSFPTI